MGNIISVSIWKETTSFKGATARAAVKELRELYIDYFFRRQDDFWKREALRKLPALKRVTNMLICGEDLGLVPACDGSACHARSRFRLSLEIQRMPKKMEPGIFTPRRRAVFERRDSLYARYEHHSRLVGVEEPPLTQKFYNRELGQQGRGPARGRAGNSPAAVLRRHLESPGHVGAFSNCAR